VTTLLLSWFVNFIARPRAMLCGARCWYTNSVHLWKVTVDKVYDTIGVWRQG